MATAVDTTLLAMRTTSSAVEVETGATVMAVSVPVAPFG